MRRIPIIATLVVLAAVVTMIALGFWQLRRMHEKEALLAQYAAAQSNPALVHWTAVGVGPELLYRRAWLTCHSVTNRSSIAGRNASGEPGLAQTARCALPGGGSALVVLGWSRQLDRGEWRGGHVTGVIAPGPRLVAIPSVGGLEANALPDPSELPNNHLSYAMQWFFFAATAFVIFVVELRRRR
ncbi:SURF1 family cytochrome oxidase biogenesis protein [Novosphingobium panipatense]|jgi:cytochrome oxidase assembly protein ShyY1|uniref:SURF1 family cytochrome oxidase biogenesis protein n=1 Tax=Novosphingobium TaxID=165696 RepID=UPI000CDA4B1D|nr:SURF1 family cytochrome oxidase biogenesis protein [Novosphingobium sp. HII-3]